MHFNCSHKKKQSPNEFNKKKTNQIGVKHETHGIHYYYYYSINNIIIENRINVILNANIHLIFSQRRSRCRGMPVFQIIFNQNCYNHPGIYRRTKRIPVKCAISNSIDLFPLEFRSNNYIPLTRNQIALSPQSPLIKPINIHGFCRPFSSAIFSFPFSAIFLFAGVCVFFSRQLLFGPIMICTF